MGRKRIISKALLYTVLCIVAFCLLFLIYRAIWPTTVVNESFFTEAVKDNDDDEDDTPDDGDNTSEVTAGAPINPDVEFAKGNVVAHAQCNSAPTKRGTAAAYTPGKIYKKNVDYATVTTIKPEYMRIPTGRSVTFYKSELMSPATSKKVDGPAEFCLGDSKNPYTFPDGTAVIHNFSMMGVGNVSATGAPATASTVKSAPVGFEIHDGIHVYKDLIFTGIYSKTSKNMTDRIGGTLLADERRDFENSFEKALAKHYRANNINEYFKILLTYAKNNGLLGKQTGQGAFELMIYMETLILNFIDIINKNKIEDTRKDDILKIRNWINNVVNHCSRQFADRGNNKLYIYASVNLLNIFIKYKYYPTTNNSRLVNEINAINKKVEKLIINGILDDGYIKAELMRCSRAFSYHAYTLRYLINFLDVLKAIKTYPAFKDVSFDYKGTEAKLYALINKTEFRNESERKTVIANIEKAVQENADRNMERIRREQKYDPKKYEGLLAYREYKGCCTQKEYNCIGDFKQVNISSRPYKDQFDYLYYKKPGNKTNIEKIISGSK